MTVFSRIGSGGSNSSIKPSKISTSLSNKQRHPGAHCLIAVSAFLGSLTSLCHVLKVKYQISFFLADFLKLNTVLFTLRGRVSWNMSEILWQVMYFRPADIAAIVTGTTSRIGFASLSLAGNWVESKKTHSLRLHVAHHPQSSRRRPAAYRDLLAGDPEGLLMSS